MRLARLDVSCADLEDLPVLVGDEDRPLVIHVSDADTVTALAGVGGGWSGSWGVWLVAGPHYGAGLIARDVKTLARLLQVDHVVVEAAADAPLYASAVDALLQGVRVTLENAVAHLHDAYNLPAPTRPVTVWSVEGDRLRSAHGVVRRDEVRGSFTYYAE